jgi:branched-chain amino acid transport system substrate-binding protein
LTFGVVTSLTGNASSSFSDTEIGVKAAVDEINAAGGVNGRQLKYVMADDQSNPTQNLTAVKDLVENKNVTAIGSWDAFLFASADYLKQKGTPVVGGGFDGPEWGTPGYENMFSVPGSTDPSLPAFDMVGKFLKSKGVTKLASLAYGPSPSAIAASKASGASAKAAGIDVVYTNYNVPFGSTDFTNDALAIKQSGADAIEAPMVQASDIALLTAVKQAGVDLKVPLFYTGYDQNTLNDKAAAAGFDGAYVTVAGPFADPSNPAVKRELDSLHAAGFKGDVPTFGAGGGYIVGHIMACAFQAGGADPTPQSIVAGLRKVTGYDSGGLQIEKTNFATGFGKGSTIGGSTCLNVVQLTSGKFTLVTPQPLCGTAIPGTNQK